MYSLILGGCGISGFVFVVNITIFVCHESYEKHDWYVILKLYYSRVHSYVLWNYFVG